MNKLKTSVLKNEVYVGEEQILDEKDTKMGFTDQDLPEVQEIIKKPVDVFSFFKGTKIYNDTKQAKSVSQPGDEKTSGRKPPIHE